MSRLLRILGLTAALLLVAGLLGLGATTAVADETEPDPALTGAPEVRACYDLTAKQAWGDYTRETTVDCTRRHTLLVGAVATLPASVDWKDSKAVSAASKKICNPFWHTYYRSDRASSYLTLLQGVWFQPTPEQRTAGARWISCLIGVATDDSLLPIPASGPAKATTKPVASIARCGTKRYATVPCAKTHAWRATYAFTATATGSEKKVTATLDRAASRVCERKVTSSRWLRSWRQIGTNKYAVACYTQTAR